MALGRRWPTLIIFVGSCIALLVFFHRPSLQPPLQYPSPPSFESHSPLQDGTFQWKDVPRHYPIEHLRQLPEGIAHQLPRVQYDFPAESQAEKDARLSKRKEVQKTFERCYHSYRDKAWLKDELRPLSGYPNSAFGGWAATLVDSLDTLHIMGMTEELEYAISALEAIDFSRATEDDVNIFETTIRYVGGFLAAYDLTGDERVLKKAVELGEMLLVAFDTPNHMPQSRWKWRMAVAGIPQTALSSTIVAELGSLTLEFTRLSQVTGDSRWYDAVARIMDLFEAQQYDTRLPGLWPVTVDAKTASLTKDSYFTLSAMADSLYEYLPKTHALLGGLDPVYKKLYEGAMNVSIEHLLFRPMLPGETNILFSGNARVSYNGDVSFEPQAQHLGCFVGGMLALGGRLFDRPEHVSLGRRVTDGCIWAYGTFPWGIMAETFHLLPCVSKVSCTWNRTAWVEAVRIRNAVKDVEHIEDAIIKKHLPEGVVRIGDKRYMLRPEAIESIFVLYRITGDKSLQDAAWKMFTAIQGATQTPLANAELIDVTNDRERPKQRDRMESFWMAETLKYFYLIFSEPDLISLDEWVFNTEAHPLRRPRS